MGLKLANNVDNGNARCYGIVCESPEMIKGQIFRSSGDVIFCRWARATRSCFDKKGLW